MGKNKKVQKPQEEYEHYFDGISPELEEKLSKMTPEEREKDLEEERKKCEQLPGW